jgi:hypothetical protein
MGQTSTKNIQSFNARDLHQTFVRLYDQKFHKAYQVKSFIGYEMKGLKSLLAKHDVFSILCAIKTCIQSHNSEVTVHYLLSDMKEYLPTKDNAEVQWLVGDYGDSDTKHKWREFLLCSSQWFPSATQYKKQKELLVELKEWANAEKKKQGWVD